jgi:hypothetical protein
MAAGRKIGTKFNEGIENFLSNGFSVLVVNPEVVRTPNGSIFSGGVNRKGFGGIGTNRHFLYGGNLRNIFSHHLCPFNLRQAPRLLVCHTGEIQRNPYRQGENVLAKPCMLFNPALRFRIGSDCKVISKRNSW